MSRPVSAQPSAEGWGSDLCQPVISGLSSYLLPLGSASIVLAAGRTGQCVDTCFWFLVTAVFLAPFASGLPQTLDCKP